MHHPQRVVLTLLMLFVSASSLLCTTQSLKREAFASINPILYVDPNLYEASQIGESVIIRVKIAYITNFTGFQIKVKFNNTLLWCTSASMGAVFPPAYRPKPKIRVNNIAGEVYIQSHAGDINLDGMVSLPDLTILAKHYGHKPPNGHSEGTPAYYECFRADIDNNGIVGLSDLVTLSTNYRKIYPINVGPVGVVLLQISFNATYGSRYPYKEVSQIGILESTVYAGNPPQPVSHNIQNGTYKTPYAPPELELTLTTDKDSYFFGEKINVTGSLSGNGYLIPDALIALQVNDIAGNVKALRILTTSSLQISCPVEVVSFYPCDRYGYPQDTFHVGTLAYFNITIVNNSPRPLQAVLYVNAYDSSNASLGLTTLQSTFSVGRTTAIFSIPVQEFATSGCAIAYAGVLTDFPRNNGTALSMERKTLFTIIGSSEGNPTFMGPLPQGYYGTILCFQYIGQASGYYTIIATTKFMERTTVRTKQILISFSG